MQGMAEDVPCFWAQLRHAALPALWREAAADDAVGGGGPHTGVATHICTTDPAVDSMLARSIHRDHWYGQAEQIVFIERAPCTPERPFFLDVGANIGTQTLVALRYGCRTVSFEPMPQNAARLWQSISRNGLADRATLFRAAAGAVDGAFFMLYEAANPGASRLLQSVGSKDEAAALALPGTRSAAVAALARRTGVSAASVVLAHSVPVDALLLHGEGDAVGAAALLPQHPTLGRPMQAGDIAAVKIDAEGMDVAALHGMRSLLLHGRPPVVFIEFKARYSAEASQCDVRAMLRFMYGPAGYVVTHEGAGGRRRAVPLQRLLKEVDAELGTGVPAPASSALAGSCLWFERNDTVGLEARGGEPLPPFEEGR